MEDKNSSKKDLDYDYIEYMYGVDLRPSEEIASEKKEIAESETEKKTADTAKMELYDWVQCIVAALLCGILIFVFVGRVIGVDGTSMVPTLQNNDRIIVSKLFYTPRYGDVVVFKTEYYGDSPLVKRIIATEGQTVDIDFTTGEVMIDGWVLKEDYINELTNLEEDFKGPVTVPEGFVFVMGDNRNASTDSRSDKVGLVDTRQILGKAYWVIIPGADSSNSRDWSRIGSVYK